MSEKDTIEFVKRQHETTKNLVEQKKKRICNAFYNGIEILILALIPYLYSILWPNYSKVLIIYFCILVFIIAFSIRYKKDKSRLRAKLKLTRALTILIKNFEDLEGQVNRLSDEYSLGKKKLQSVGYALEILSESIKNDIKNRTVSVSLEGGIISEERKFTATSLMAFIKKLCLYGIKIIKLSVDRNLLEQYVKDNESFDVSKFENYFNFSLIIPKEKELVSLLIGEQIKKIQDVGINVAKIALQRFSDKKDNLYLIIPDTKNDNILQLDENLTKYMRSIIALIIYSPNSQDNNSPSGVLFVSSPLKNIFTEERIKIISPYFSPVYRLLASKLLLPLQEKNIIDKMVG